ncbi:MAG: FkbM family methyltransferase [Bacteroidia bacterium]|jgi:FkbM family methyltransferase|nr:FkbM family methyltransferase [Bacteroidia bacterium]
MLKQCIRQVLWALHLDLTQNLKYDRATQKAIRLILKPESNAIDVGAHKGEILRQIALNAPKGQHLAIEPIPSMAERLKNDFNDSNCRIEQCAVSNYQGETTFQLVKNAPAYSGLKKRQYAVNTPDIEQIQVQVRTLDSLWDMQRQLDFIKLDIEGGELHALEGASTIISTFRPYVIFEFGKGSAEFYDSTPEKMFAFFKSMRMCLEPLDKWNAHSKGLGLASFKKHFDQKTAYYFIAFPC